MYVWEHLRWQMKISFWFEKALKTVMIWRAIPSILLFRVEECFTADGGSTFLPSIGRTIQDYTMSCTVPAEGMLQITCIQCGLFMACCSVLSHESAMTFVTYTNIQGSFRQPQLGIEGFVIFLLFSSTCHVWWFQTYNRSFRSFMIYVIIQWFVKTYGQVG